MAIDREDCALADEAHEDAFLIHNGKRPGSCSVEDGDDDIHRIIHGELGFGLLHELRHSEVSVQFCAENEVPDIVQINGSDELHLLVNDGEDVVLAVRDLRGDIAQVHVRVEDVVVMLYDAIHAHEGQDALVRVVGQQFASLRKPHRINAMGLEILDCEIRACSHYHERHEKCVTSRQFGDEEDACQGCVHHAAHQSAHAQHGEVPFRNVDAQHVVHVPKPAENEATDAAQKQTRREDTAAASASVGRRRGKHLEDDYKKEVDEQVVRAIEERPIHRSIPVGLSVAVKQKGDEVVSFAVERREEIDEQTQHGGSQKEFLVATLQLAEDAFQEVHCSGKVDD